MKLEHYRDLINNLPEKNHSVISEISKWTNNDVNFSKILDKIENKFKKINHPEKIEISRENLYRLGESEELDVFIIATIIWGYPNGMRGNNFNNIIKNFGTLKLILYKNKNGISNWKENWKEIELVKGLGISTYTKFLNFLNVEIEKNNALILDSRIIQALNMKIFAELTISEINYNSAHRHYTEYLKLINLQAKNLNVEAKKIEMFLFIFGSNLKNLN